MGVWAGVGGQCGDREVFTLDDEVNGSASDPGGSAEGFRPRLRVGSEVGSVGKGLGGLVSVLPALELAMAPYPHG